MKPLLTSMHLFNAFSESNQSRALELVEASTSRLPILRFVVYTNWNLTYPLKQGTNTCTPFPKAAQPVWVKQLTLLKVLRGISQVSISVYLYGSTWSVFKEPLTLISDQNWFMQIAVIGNVEKNSLCITYCLSLYSCPEIATRFLRQKGVTFDQSKGLKGSHRRH